MAKIDIPVKKLGRTDMMVTELALGGVGIGGGRTSASDDAQGIETLKYAIESGMNYVDTSPLYGVSEQRIGMAFAEMGGRPEGLFLSTKTGTHEKYMMDFSPEATRWTVENSLKVLGVDSVDLMFIHSQKAYMPSLEPLLEKGGCLDTLDTLRDEGKFKWIGMAIRERDLIETMIRTGRIDAIMTFGSNSLVRQTGDGLVKECQDRGVGVVLGFVYMSGLLAGEDPAERVKKPGAIPDRLYPFHLIARDWWLWAQEKGVSLRSVALQYGLRNPNVDCVVVGCASPKHVDESLEAAYEPLSDELWEEVDYRIKRQND